MNEQHANKLQRNIRAWIIFVMAGLVVSGITAFPLEMEMAFGMNYLHWFPSSMQDWAMRIYEGVSTTNRHYPFIAYGTDWLAFAHIVIAVAFIGPLMDPIRNIWVIRFGMIACIMVFPLALIAGPIRGIPFFWQLIDCSFGAFGLVPLYTCHRLIKKLEASFPYNPAVKR